MKQNIINAKKKETKTKTTYKCEMISIKKAAPVWRYHPRSFNLCFPTWNRDNRSSVAWTRFQFEAPLSTFCRDSRKTSQFAAELAPASPIHRNIFSSTQLSTNPFFYLWMTQFSLPVSESSCTQNACSGCVCAALGTLSQLPRLWQL